MMINDQDAIALKSWVVKKLEDMCVAPYAPRLATDMNNDDWLRGC